MNVELQQVLNVLNAWLATVDLRVRGNSDGEGVVYDGTRELGKRDEPFPTVPHAVEWALSEAARRIGISELGRRLDAAFSDNEDGDDDAR